ncbi:S8 family peptidase [Parageobacillus toebii]|uniref:S8 family peptidase n=1 Tax=Parageobacillus toebii TaxID=153151 RepID=UPI0035B50390
MRNPFWFVLCFFIGFVFLFEKDVHGQSLSEWLIYFHNENDYSLFMEKYRDRVKDEEKEKQWVVKALFTREEIDGIEKLPIVSKVEPNYQKSLASSVFNDPLVSQQWGINKIDIWSVAPKFHQRNILIGKQIVTTQGAMTYEGQPLHTLSFSILSEEGMKLSRLSVTVDHVENLWTLQVMDQNGQVISQNNGNLPTLDVLLPKNQTYKALQIHIQANGWKEPPVITNVTAVDHVLVAVIDTGAAIHKDFCGNVLHSLGRDYVHPGRLALDDHGHGTHVTGIIAACANNHEGIVGTAGFAPVDVVPFKVLDREGTGGDFEIAKAVNDAVSIGANVINLSLAGKGKTLVLEQAVQNALRHHVVVVAAAGNWGIPIQDVYPASYPGVIAVAAMDENNQIIPYSDYGWKVDISAPGENILSTYMNNEYRTLSGTSMAAPFVSSVAALIKAMDPRLDDIQIRKRLFESAKDIQEKGYDTHSGYGVVQAAKAIHLPYSEAVDWLTIQNGQPVSFSKQQLLGISKGLIGKDVYVFIDDQLVEKRNSDDHWISFVLPDIPSARDEQKLTVISADHNGEVVAFDERWINSTSSASASFTDVPSSFWAYKEIQTAYREKWINGFTNHIFRPNALLTRRHAVMMMNRLFQWRPKQIQSPFLDTPLTMAGAVPIYAAYDQRIVKGYDNGHFYPERFVTRAQMAVMLARALKLSERSFSGTPYAFKDIDGPGHFAYYAVQQLADKGIITKQPYFRPNEFLTRAQFAAMLARTYRYMSNRN